MTSLPEIRSYGQYSSDNYGANSLLVDFGKFRLYYSYETIVAYYDAKDGKVVCENIWGTTTGKHLNWIHPDHSIRISRNEFEQKLQAMLERHLS